MHGPIGNHHRIRAGRLKAVLTRHFTKNGFPQRDNTGGSGVMRLPISQDFFHGFTGMYRDVERWVAGLQTQDFTIFGLLFQQAVAHLDNCTKRHLINNVSHLFLTFLHDKFVLFLPKQWDYTMGKDQAQNLAMGTSWSAKRLNCGQNYLLNRRK